MLFQPRSPFLMTIMATRAGFLVAGLGLSVWAPLVPYVRQRIPMDDATFGLLLLSIGLGSLCCMPLTALLTERFGIRHTLPGAATLLITALCGMIVSSQFGVLALALFCFGGSMGVLDIVLNVQGLAVESRANRNLMSGFHGMFSLGTIMGALLVSLLLMAGLSPVVSPLLAVACMAVLCLWAQPGFIDRRTRRDPDGLRWPSGFIILIGLMCFIVYLAEGAILDWSALFLIDFRAMPPASAGLGYAAFALMITIGRFSGDNLSKKLGRVAVIGGGGVLAAAGIGLSLVSQHWGASLAWLRTVWAGLRQCIAVADVAAQPTKACAATPCSNGRHHHRFCRRIGGAGHDGLCRTIQLASPRLCHGCWRPLAGGAGQPGHS